MKKLLKELIRKSSFLSDVFEKKGLGTKVRFSTLFGNYVINLLLRQNTSYSLWTNFKSTIIAGEKLVLKSPQRGTFSSLANSSGCYIQAGNGVIIGNGTIWASNVVIVSANHNLDEKDKGWESSKPVEIGENCWIGANACIMPGVVLGDRVVVGAGAVVTKEFRQNDIVLAGNPAKVIKFRRGG